VATAPIAQFQNAGAVPKRALTLGTPRTSCAVATSGRFLVSTFVNKKLIQKKSSLNLHMEHLNNF
jgi:hypothetical protein